MVRLVRTTSTSCDIGWLDNNGLDYLWPKTSGTFRSFNIAETFDIVSNARVVNLLKYHRHASANVSFTNYVTTTKLLEYIIKYVESM